MCVRVCVRACMKCVIHGSHVLWLCTNNTSPYRMFLISDRVQQRTLLISENIYVAVPHIEFLLLYKAVLLFYISHYKQLNLLQPITDD